MYDDLHEVLFIINEVLFASTSVGRVNIVWG